MNPTKEDRIQLIQKIIVRKSLDFSMGMPVDTILKKTSKSWMEHFDKWGIPTERLMDVYEEAMLGRDERTMFTPTTMFQAWERIKKIEVQNNEFGNNKICVYCKNTGKLEYYQPGIGDIVKECPYH